MAKGFKHGAGGAALNFKVVGGADQPENPKENTIWVNTDTGITGWVFSPSEPEEPEEGMVWISTGTSSNAAFNALKKNTVMVYPLSAQQYIGGAWEDRTAKSCQGGEWVDWWSGQLYTPGNEWEQVTGGWQARGWKLNSSYTAKAPDLTKSDTCMSASISSASNSGVVETAMDIDFTNYSTIHFEYDNVGRTGGYFKVAVVPRDAAYYSTNAIASFQPDNSTSIAEASLDISGVTGTADLVFGLHIASGGTGKNVLNIYRVWLE